MSEADRPGGKVNGADLVATQLVRQGVRAVFGLPGHLEAVFGALDARGVRVLHLRHEAAVVMAADGAARVTRSVQVACVTAGPGLANALGGLATTAAAGTPVLLLCGRNEALTRDANAFQDLDHLRLARPLVKWAATVEDPALVAEYVDRACNIALAGHPGPVLLELPRDVVQAPVPAEAPAASALAPLAAGDRPLPAPAAIDRAARLVAGAERPIVIAGNGAYWSGAGQALSRLAETHGVPVLGRALARGLVPEDLELGFPWPYAYPAARHADVVVLAGSRLGGPTAFGAPPFFSEAARFVQIDIDAAEIGTARRPEAPVVGDCSPALDGLAARLSELGGRRRSTAWIADALAEKRRLLAAIPDAAPGGLHPVAIGRALAARLPHEAIWVGDGANCLSWLKTVMFVQRAPGYLDHDPLGSMGVGLPLALGAAAAQEGGDRRPVVLTTGDGALGQYLAELASASLHRLGVLVVVANDGCWGSSLGVERRLGLERPVGVELDQSRYDLAAEALGCHGELVAAPSELPPAIERSLKATAEGRPAVVNVLVDRDASADRSHPLLQSVPFHPSFADWRRRAALG